MDVFGREEVTQTIGVVVDKNAIDCDNHIVPIYNKIVDKHIDLNTIMNNGDNKRMTNLVGLTKLVAKTIGGSGNRKTIATTSDNLGNVMVVV